MGSVTLVGMTYVEPPSVFGFPFEDSAFIDLLEMTFPHPLQGAIMPVFIQRHGKPEIAGTAFSIMPNVALTAAHVLVEEGVPRSETAFLLHIGGTYPDGGLMGGLLPVEQLSLNRAADLALLRYALPEIDGAPLRVKNLPLNFAGPVVGNVCLAVGYTSGLELETDDAGGGKISIAPKLHASKGNVEEVHLAGRDAMLPYPVFRTSAHLLAQMSGSPIWSGGIGQQRVVGIVTSSYDLADDGGPPISYGSLLTPALPLSLTFMVDGIEQEVPLREMVDRGLVAGTLP